MIESIRVSSSKLEQESRKFNFQRRSRGGPVLSGCRAAPLLLLLLSLPPPEPEELLFERGYIRARQQPFYKLHHQQSVQNSLITYSLFDAYQRPKLKAFLKSESMHTTLTKLGQSSAKNVTGSPVLVVGTTLYE